MTLRIERDLPPEGEAAPDDAEATGEARTLLAELLAFRRSGWGSWTEWLALPESVRPLAASVGERVTEERLRALAALVGLAVRSVGGIAEALGDPQARAEVAEAEVLRDSRPLDLSALGGF